MSGHPFGDPVGHPVASSQPPPSPQASTSAGAGNDTDSLHRDPSPSPPTGSPAPSVSSPRPSRVRVRHVEWVHQRLTPRDVKIIDTVARLRLVTGQQLGRLHFADLTPGSRDRARRRVLRRLVCWRVLATLDRRVGGVRAGSNGLAFTLDTAGQWLHRLHTAQDAATAPRRPPQPSAAFTSHILAVTALYVGLVEASRRQPLIVREFQAEPACWWPHPAGGWLKPDAYVVLAAAGVRDAWWIEVDQATESLPCVRLKLTAYLDFAHRGGLGPTGVLPRVLITTTTPQRRHAIADLITGLPPPAGRLFDVCLHATATEHLAAALHNQ